MTSQQASRGPWVRRLLPALGLIALAGAAPLLFFACFEKRTEDVTRGMSAEARRNPYLAAQRLLERAGFEVRSFAQFTRMPRTPQDDATLILPTERRTVGAERSAELLDWVRRGGHLIVMTYSLWDDPARTPDLLLDPLGLRQGSHPLRPPASDAGDAAAVPGDDAAPDATGEAIATYLVDRVRVAFPDRDRPLEVEFDGAYYWERPEGPTWSVEGEYGIHLVQLPLGDGRVTALTDMGFMIGEGLRDHDHAEFLYRLITREGTGGPIWLITGDDWPSPLDLLRAHAWRIVLSLAVLLVAWLAVVTRRLGPPIPDPPARRRSLMEHVDAAGRLLWQHGGRGALLEAARQALLEQVRQRHPGWAELDAAHLHYRLAQVSGEPAERVQRALASAGEPGPESFTSAVRTLYRVSRSI